MKALTLLFLIAMSAVIASAQTPLSFEVASVKPNKGGPSSPGELALGCRGTDSHSPGMTIPAGRCIARNEPLRLVIALAYDIPPASMYPYQGEVLSGPSWMNNEIYDIEAKAESPTTYAELRQMLQTLLAERFKLKMHRETRQMPIYGLVRTKNPLKLTPAPEDRECGEQVRRDHRFELGATSLTQHCHAFIPGSGDVMLLGQSVAMSDLAEMLSIWAGRLVVDQTDIKGLFDVQLPRFVSGDLTARPLPAAIPQGPAGDEVRKFLDAQASMPTVHNVLDRLGLKLESTKGPVEVIVIDNLERPSEN
jgi:uncharacterized protein (TIGR03435 family)